MPKRKDIKKIMIIGAGPIVIGQACEFDYSGAQACKALKEEGFKVVLVNSNPATIMTDPELADRTYIEPLNLNILEKIIEKEKPDALLSTMGGQTALNLSIELDNSKILEKNGVKLIGASKKVIRKAEDRELFKKSMNKIGLETPRGIVVKNMDKAQKILKKLPFPLIVRPSFTLGGSGGGTVKNKEEYLKIVRKGLELSPIKEVLIEESLIGWKEYEMEVIRDNQDNCIIVCSIENIDPMGIHTGDSVTVSPALTLTDKEFQKMRNDSIKVIREIGVDTGGANVQFAINPKTGRNVVIEMNPRVSRSSALASKATGFPIARIAAKLAVGYSLDELRNDITKTTPASFEPTIDYIVTKIPRFTFEKFSDTEERLGTAMKSIGECMAIGRSFKESFQKAIRSLEVGLIGLDSNTFLEKKTQAQLISLLRENRPNKFLIIAECFRKKIPFEKIANASNYDPWFIREISEIIDTEKLLKENYLSEEIYLDAKAEGFSDEKIIKLSKSKESVIKKLKKEKKLFSKFKNIDTCSGEFESRTPYMYSSWNCIDQNDRYENETSVTNKKKVIIIGGGPNRIGQGIEFDYCCVHSSFAIKELGIESIMVNCNPETVSTDYDISDRLYFEPLDNESILEICDSENKKNKLIGVIVQLGGQTPLKLSEKLYKSRIKILGTSYQSIDLCEDRDRFSKLMKRLEINQPKSDIVYNLNQAKKALKLIQFPIVIRPSYVLGGRAMRIVNNEYELERYFQNNFIVNKRAILIDEFLVGAKELDVDAISDGNSVYISGILEHIEEAGVHSGDSACALPSQTISNKVLGEIRKITRIISKSLRIVGFINIQFAIKDEKTYVIEVNPRASRTVPFISKSIGIPLAKIATKVMLGKKLKDFNLKDKRQPYVSVKESVFPFDKFPGEDIILGPEMKSTGEVMGIDKNFPMAFLKSQMAAGNKLPKKGSIFISVRDEDKENILLLCQVLKKLNFKIFATKGTATFLSKFSIRVNSIKKVNEGSPHIVDLIKNNKIHLVINTTSGSKSIADSLSIRRTALSKRIPYFTTISAAKIAITGLNIINESEIGVKSIQELYNS
ncbi:MAG: carbamoyl-phosphate synthase large subunit [Pseudomonadota bacterium]|nr:carbamoyl-phosphate synthase large subunit [Pseudomonadota bacterium]